MSILIKGMDISPDHIQGITVFPEGFAVVEEYEMLVPIKTTKCEVVSVPTPHGRLIDVDALLTDANKLRYGEGWLITTENIEHAPMVIEAEENEDD